MTTPIKPEFTRGIILRPDDVGVSSTEGEIKVALTAKKLQIYLDGALRNIVMEATVATLTNKTIDADNNTISNLEVDNLKAGVLNISSTFSGATDSQVPSALAVKTAIDLINADLGDDVEGPASATDNAITRYDGTTGKLLQNSGVTIDDSNVLSGATQLNVDNTRLDGNTLSSTNANGNLNLAPNGTGLVDITTGTGLRSLGVEIHPHSLLSQSGSNVAVSVDPAKIYRATNSSLVSIDTIAMNVSTPQDGQEITILNVTSVPITLNNLTGAATAYQIRTGTGAALVIQDGESVSLVYNAVEAEWMVVGTQVSARYVPMIDLGYGFTDVEQNIQALFDDEAATNQALNDHIVDATDAHDASAISNVPSGNLAATNIQSAVNELQTDIDTRALQTALDAEATARSDSDAVLLDDINTKITGPVSSVDNHLVRYDGTSGTLAQDGSPAVLSDAGILSGLTGLESSGTVNISEVLVEGQEAANITGGATNAQIENPTAPVIRITSSVTSIECINDNTTGRVLTIINDSGAAVTLLNDTGAVTYGRIVTGTGLNLTLADQASVLLKYDGTDTRWRIIGGSGSGGGGQSLDTIFQLVGDDIANWSTGDNATFLGGGTLAGTFAADTSTPLQGDKSYLYTQAASSLDDYLASPAQAVDVRFRGQEVTLYFPYTYDGANNDIEVIFYDATNAAVIPSSAFIQASTDVSIFKTNVTIPLTCSSIQIGFMTRVLNSGKIFEFDSVQLTSDSTVYADIANITPWTSWVPTGSWSTNTTYSGKWRQVGENLEMEVLVATSGAPTSAALTINLPDGFTIDTNKLNSSSTLTTSLGKGMVNDSGSALYSVYPVYASSTSVSILQEEAATTYVRAVSVSQVVPVTWAAGDKLQVNIKVPVAQFTAYNRNILTAPETFSTDTAPLVYASSATYTLATLANAPVGTFITYTYAINTNTRTQTTTAPTQTTADMNSNGIQIFARAYNAASTAANPAVVAIQIGKGLKGKNLDLYKSTSKGISDGASGRIDLFIAASNTEYGCRFSDYNEATGVLILDAGVRASAITVSGFLFSDLSSQTDGYLVINASKNPALTGMNIGAIAARYTSTAGGAIGTSLTLQTFETKDYDTNGAYSAGVFTVPESGYYDITASMITAAVTLSTAQSVILTIYINGVAKSSTAIKGNGANTSYPIQSSDTYKLIKDDTVSVYVNSSVATSQNTAAGYNYLSIHKTNVG